MGQPTISLPAWVVIEGRSMSPPAARMLLELFVQGDRVKGARGVEYVRWGRPLEALGACATSSVLRAKHELVERGLLIEQPGARLVNNRPVSAWMVPVVMDVYELATRLGYEQAPISVDAREQAPISVVAPVESDTAHKRGGEQAPISVVAPLTEEQAPISVVAPVESDSAHKRGGEQAPISVVAQRSESRANIKEQIASSKVTVDASRTRARPTPSSSSAAGGVVVAKLPPKSVVAPGTDDSSGEKDLNSTGPGEMDGELAYGVALEGLRAARVRHPEDVLRQHRLNSVLGALREWVEASEAHAANPLHPRVMSPSGFVMSRAKLEYSAVMNIGFARWWDPAGTPEKVVSLALRKGSRP